MTTAQAIATIDIPDRRRRVVVEHGDLWGVARLWDASKPLPLPDQSVDLIVTSPPYDAARRYGTLDFKLEGEAWAVWARPIFMECLRVCRGPVCWVVQGTTTDYRWSAAPSILEADLHRAGVCLRRPLVYARSGIPGSGGPDYRRCDDERIIVATRNPGRLPWWDHTWKRQAPKYEPGGPCSSRNAKGDRVIRRRRSGSGKVEGYRFKPPAFVNQGSVLRGPVGKGHMGSTIAHENEAPFPEWLADDLIRSFCPPGGIVLDPMAGSGTTAAAAMKAGRNAIVGDIRKDQVDLIVRRMREVADGRPVDPGEVPT